MEIIHLISGRIEDTARHKINRIVESIGASQKKLGNKVAIWCIDYRNKPKFFRNRTKFREFSNSTKMLKVSESLREALNEKKSTAIFHLHGGFIFEYFLIARLLNKIKTNYTYSPHRMFHTKEGRIKSFFNHLYFKTIEKKIVIPALNIQCAELCELNLITRHFPRASVSLIPIGDIAIDRDFKFNPLRKRESLIFGYSGKLVLKENGLDLLLQGFARYKKKFNGDAYLWIVSTSDTSDQLINLASSLRIDHAVKFFKVSEEQELMYLSNIDVLFSSARLFSDHSSLIKAAKLGIPMVINNYSSISDHVKKYQAGIILSRNKATNIATAMKKMEAHFVSHTMRQFGENALKMAEQEYQWENIATNMQTIYRPL